MGPSPLGGRRDPALLLWPLASLLLPLLPLLVLLLSALEGPRRLVMVVPEGPRVLSAPFELKDGWLGSPRLALTADIPPNSTIELDVALLDASGRTVLNLTKDGWRASGTWSEEGETGTWEEADAALTLAMRPGQSGLFQLAVQLQDLLDEAGQPLPNPVVVRGSVRNHSLDAPLLLFTAALTLAVVQVLLLACYGVSRGRWVRRSQEADAAIRCEAGGPGLLRVGVVARWELPHDNPPLGQPPEPAALELRVSDALGRPRLRHRGMVVVAHRSDDGDHWLSVRQTLHLRLPERGSYRFRVRVPEEFRVDGDAWEMEWLQLTVEDGLMSAWPVAVLPLDGALEAR
ncbi:MULTISPECIES: hypothetical protein [unclassified Cyanobium]|uniref:hypothetical protein n=1 Tax=unclassified Cyanobium TaxID=2627006 RepID=UPI0020CCBDC1|nr:MULTISPECIES: hypothetical protein [unclassified Cyanobium]MCP9833254.1 hypothetical protein [Cyanobium sp. La Preciosa 7G6]MCP9935883.1 hypothetical protein [Cyanobium sp. Aljojuca 7A6]